MNAIDKASRPEWHVSREVGACGLNQMRQIEDEADEGAESRPFGKLLHDPRHLGSPNALSCIIYVLMMFPFYSHRQAPIFREYRGLYSFQSLPVLYLVGIGVAPAGRPSHCKGDDR
jgi:hypothetical protein